MGADAVLREIPRSLGENMQIYVGGPSVGGDNSLNSTLSRRKFPKGMRLFFEIALLRFR
jgi:hypothetical protein